MLSSKGLGARRPKNSSLVSKNIVFEMCIPIGPYVILTPLFDKLVHPELTFLELRFRDTKGVADIFRRYLEPSHAQLFFFFFFFILVRVQKKEEIATAASREIDTGGVAYFSPFYLKGSSIHSSSIFSPYNIIHQGVVKFARYQFESNRTETNTQGEESDRAAAAKSTSFRLTHSNLEDRSNHESTRTNISGLLHPQPYIKAARRANSSSIAQCLQTTRQRHSHIRRFHSNCERGKAGRI